MNTIPKSEARRLGAEIIALFAGTCERMELFGDLYAVRPDVRSIEIRCVPYRTHDWDGDDNPVGEPINRQWQKVRELLKQGVFQHRHGRGYEAASESYQRLTYKDTPVEIFCLKCMDHWPSSEEAS